MCLLFTMASQPAGGNQQAVDVNRDCVKDYTGKAVTPENFFNILTGNKTAAAAAQALSPDTRYV
jgi:hypothetical protein